MAGPLRDPTTVGACHSGAMTEPFALYDAARARMLTLAEDVGPDALCTVVPACPDWTALDLLTHCVAMPAAIATGDLPRDDLGAWLDAILAARAGRTLEELRTEWYEVDPTIAVMVEGSGGILLDDLVVHEHDLRGALDRPDHAVLDPEVFVPRALASCVAELDRRGLGAIEVLHGPAVWRSHDAPTGWVLEVSPWEAVRILYSRRTADELRACGGSEDIEGFIALLDDHLPLPRASLHEA